MSIFDFTDYKSFVEKAFAERPKRGRGQFRKLAQTLRLSSVAVSQIFRGPRELSLEHALETARFLSLTQDETDHFLLLVQRARAGTQDLKKHLDRRIEKARAEREQLSKRVKQDFVLTDEIRAIFYSNWHYSAVRIASSIPGLHGVDTLASRLNLKREVVADVAEFLLKHGLCVREADGIRMGPSSTMLPADSPFINNHRRNWRLKGLEHLQRLTPRDLFYSGLVSISDENAAAFREELVQLIARLVDRAQESSPEKLTCLNLDWFEP